VKHNASFAFNLRDYQEIKDIVLSVPSHFNDYQRQQAKDAFQLPGFRVLRIINEPTASCISYGLDSSKRANHSFEMDYLILDLGSNKLEMSHLMIEEGIYEVMQTKTSSAKVGGRFIQNLIIKYCLQQFKRDTGISINQPRAIKLLKREVERAVEELSYSNSQTIEVKNILSG
jgi:molecular chaperone DnaK